MEAREILAETLRWNFQRLSGSSSRLPARFLRRELVRTPHHATLPATPLAIVRDQQFIPGWERERVS